LAAIPKQTSGQEQPFPVVWYAHGHARSFVESLLFAGTLAEQGLATLSINAPLHGVSLDAGTEAALDALFEQACAAPLNSALHRGRARDTDGDARLDSGSGWYDARVFHTRDLVRQTVVDALQLFRSLELLETNGAADFDGDGRNDLSTAGGVSAWGQSVGGAVATIAASVEPSITALAVGSSNAAFSDLLATTSSPLIVSEALLTILGPLVIGTPVSELVASGTLTQCQSGEVSLRFVLPAPGRPVELEFGCFDPVTATSGRGLESGASVLLTNGDNGQVRCTRMDSEGRFRVSIPTSVGDRLELQVWDQPNAVDSYHPDTGCNVDDSGVNRIALVNAWQLPANYRGQAFAPNMRLLAPIDGLGRQRQTPSLRRLFELMSHGFSAADPASFAAPLTLGGRNSPTKPILSYVTAGDTTSPVSGGIALARAFGLVPFLRPHSDSQYPDYADFVTPAELFSQLANKTPNRLLVDTHVVEGVARLERHPPAETCGHNEPPAAEGSDVCHAPCTMDDQSSCLSHQECQAGRCTAAAVDTRTCADFLFDVDALAEGRTGLNQRQSTVPLRLARVAAREGDPLKIWRPRLQAAPFSSDDFGFSAEEPLRAHVQAYLHPLGTHALGAPERCARFASSLYMARLVARFFSSHGQDIYYLSHPATHQCLAESELCASLTQ
jgi:hypothetical protein